MDPNPSCNSVVACVVACVSTAVPGTLLEYRKQEAMQEAPMTLTRVVDVHAEALMAPCRQRDRFSAML